MAASANSGDDDFISAINVTPLVDVVLVLLIIFMITAPTIYQSAIKVQLPKASSGEEPQRSPLSFAITRDGSLYWDRDRVEWGMLGRKLASLEDRVKDDTAVISADETTPHGTVIRLMDALRSVGLSRIALSVESKSPPPKADRDRQVTRTAGADASTNLRVAELAK